MTRHRSRGLPATLFGLLAVLAVPPAAARAQAVDCTALRGQIDAAARAGDPGRFDMALRQQRDEILRTRAYADATGCGDGFFDDPNSPACRALARRIGALQVALQRLQDQAGGDPAADGRRRALQDQFDARCSDDRAGAEPPTSTLPTDPDAPPAEAPATPARSPVVLCVRRCDGAYYPLAVDVRSDRLGDMDRVCQAQCPAAASSAYAGRDADDPGGALASDGSAYSALSTAFLFRKGPTPRCACRAPQQTWAEALAGAEALLEPHKGDVTVTPALAAAMARPVSTPSEAPRAAKPAPSARTAPKTARPAPLIPTPDPAQPPDPARDLTREFRRSAPTL